MPICLALFLFGGTAVIAGAAAWLHALAGRPWWFALSILAVAWNAASLYHEVMKP